MATRLKFVVREPADVVEAPAMSGWKLCKPKSIVDVELHALTTPADKLYFEDFLGNNELVYVRGVDKPPQGYSLRTLAVAVAVSCLFSGLFGFSASRGGWELAITLAKLSALGFGLGIARMTPAAAALACSTMIEHMRPRFSTVFQQWQQWWAPVST